MGLLDLITVDIYTAIIPTELNFSNLFPDEREREVLSCSNLRVKKEKYYAWKLLEYALKNSLGYNIQDLEFNKSEEGKWECKECHFSISHSQGVVAVAISKKPVGIDLEQIRTINQKAVEKSLTESEKEVVCNFIGKDKNLALLTAWSKKESYYKSIGHGAFLPSKIDTSKYDFYTNILAIKNHEYLLTISSEKKEDIRLFENILL